METVTAGGLTDGLKALGIRRGMQLLVHSSLSSFGTVEGGADTVIDALLSLVTSDGTVIVPTLTGSETLTPGNPPVFDPDINECWTGLIPETFRRRREAVRSLHATHSVAAIGAAAEEVTREHIDSITPCDEQSPYGLLAGLDEAYILLIGVGHESNTTLHHVEELAGVDYHLQRLPCRSLISAGGSSFERTIFLHRYGQPRKFNAIEPVLVERGIERRARIGQAEIRLVHTRGLVRTGLRCLRADPRFFCADD